MTWNSEADQQLLLAILAAHEVKIDSEAVASRLGEHCTPRAVVERLKKLKKQAIAQDDSAQSAPMPKASPVKKRKRVVPAESAATDNKSAADSVEKSAQVEISATSTLSTGRSFRESRSTERSPPRSNVAGDSVKKKGKSSGRGLMPVKQTQTLGTSYAESAVSAGPILLEERRQDSPHKVKVFSSQKLPQPFLDR